MTNDRINVGDIYRMSWGYDQTNNTFFRVKELRGKTQVVVQEVYLPIKNREGMGFMAENREYDPDNYTIRDRSIFIKDNEKGKICKIKSWKV